MENVSKRRARSFHVPVSLILIIMLAMLTGRFQLSAIAANILAVSVDDETEVTIANTRWRATTLDRTTGVTSQDVTITNTSGQILYAPLIAIAKNVAPALTAVNADGTKPNGDPYWNYTALLTTGKLPAGDSVTMRWEFDNPTRSYFTYTVAVEAALAKLVTATANPTSGDAPLGVSFSAATTDPITNYEWDFDGDGVYDYSSATSANASYNYTAPGTYNATIRVTDAATGTTVTDTIQITVANPVKSLPSAFPTSGIVPMQVTFTAAGTSSTGTLEHFYWDYDGDGTVDRHLRIPDITQHTYTTAGTYNAALRVVDSNSQEHTASVAITVDNAPPTVTATVDTDNGPPPLTVNFTGTASSPNGDITLYEWDFDGDGTYDWSSSTTAQTSHTYTTLGIFNATLRVTDVLGLTETAVVVIRTQPLTATAGADTTAGNAPLQVSFTGSATSPTGDIVEYQWDFNGDGTYDWTSNTTGNTTHTYTEGGIFDATFKAKDATGAEGTYSVTITVNIVISISVNPAGFNPTQGETTTVQTTYSGTATINVLVKDKGKNTIRTLVSGANRVAGQYDDVWDGLDDSGAIVPDDAYYFIVDAIMSGGLTQTYDVTGTTGGTRRDRGGGRVSMPSSFAPYKDQFCPINYNIPQPGEVSFYIYALRNEHGQLLYDIRVKTIFERIPHAAGSYTAIWEGTNDQGQLVRTDWKYIVTIWSWDLPDNGVAVTGASPIISNVSSDPNYYDPSYHADVPVGFRDVTVSYTVSENADVTLKVFDSDNNLVRTITQASVSAGDNTIVWDGRNEAGELMVDKKYNFGVKAADAQGNKSPTMYALIVLFY